MSANESSIEGVRRATLSPPLQPTVSNPTFARLLSFNPAIREASVAEIISEAGELGSPASQSYLAAMTSRTHSNNNLVGSHNNSTAVSTYRPSGGLAHIHRQSMTMASELAEVKERLRVSQRELRSAHAEIDRTAKAASAMYYCVKALIEGVEQAKLASPPLQAYSGRSVLMDPGAKASMIRELLVDLGKETIEAMSTELEGPDSFGGGDWDHSDVRVATTLEDMSGVLDSL